MDEFSYLSVLISVILGLAVMQILKGVPRNLAVAGAGSDLLAGHCLGRVLASDLFAELVVDVRDAKAARLDVPPVHNGAAEHSFYLHDDRVGLSRLFWQRSCRS